MLLDINMDFAGLADVAVARVCNSIDDDGGRCCDQVYIWGSAPGSGREGV